MDPSERMRRMTRAKPRKWIAKKIASLDPHSDYAEIWKLLVIYRSNDAFMDLLYSITFPNFVVPNHGALAVLREGSGKVFRQGERRMDDTARHILIWSEFGPGHEMTRRSVESLNAMHSFWAKKYPSSFGHNEDYLYTLCYEATLFHRLMQRAGLRGFSEKEQTAAWEFWSRMAPLFRNVETGEPISEFPSSFAGCVMFVESFENTRRPPNAYSAQIDETMIQAFSRRHLPKVLRPIGRMLALSLLPEGTLRGLGLRAPSNWVKKICRSGFGLFLTVGDKVLPDPTTSHPEQIRARTGASVEEYVAAVTGGSRPSTLQS
jgi:hypothetical protein